MSEQPFERVLAFEPEDFDVGEPEVFDFFGNATNAT